MRVYKRIQLTNYEVVDVLVHNLDEWYVRLIPDDGVDVYMDVYGEFDINHECHMFPNKAEAFGAMASYIGRRTANEV